MAAPGVVLKGPKLAELTPKAWRSFKIKFSAFGLEDDEATFLDECCNKNAMHSAPPLDLGPGQVTGKKAPKSFTINSFEHSMIMTILFFK